MFVTSNELLWVRDYCDMCQGCGCGVAVASDGNKHNLSFQSRALE